MGGGATKVVGSLSNSAWNKWSDHTCRTISTNHNLDEHLVYEWTETVEDGDDVFPQVTSPPDLMKQEQFQSDVVGHAHDAECSIVLFIMKQIQILILL